MRKCHLNRDLDEVKARFSSSLAVLRLWCVEPRTPLHPGAGDRETGWVGQQVAALGPAPDTAAELPSRLDFGITDKFGLKKIP